ncbi:MAG: hypothetical protein AB1324_04505 [Candidatus Micrarchaeota archaeon]
MRYIALFVLAALLVFGCAGAPPAQQPGTGGTPQVPGVPGTPAEECTLSQSFSDPAEGTLAQQAGVVGTVTCAANKTIEVKLDGETVASMMPETDADQPVKLEFAPAKDGTLKLTVEIDGETVYSRDWVVKPLGNPETKGTENDAVSYKEWRAQAIDVGGPFELGRIRVFMKRFDFRTQEGTKIVVEVREDSAGKPGSVVSSVERPMNVTTLSENWINFDFQDKPALSEGRYWVVMRVAQTKDVKLASDIINVHYVALDKQAPGNEYTMEMRLTTDQVTGEASETSWQPLSYDRSYSIIVQAAS